ncbi:MAG: DEAD/DEAH box helicase [Nitrospirae bacterium]|nr:DEAD/DEAH box helicase [Nitrospirota bacterium]
MSFEKMGLSPEILKALKSKNYVDPTPIQSKAIPVIMQGKDLIGCAQTGTGKTAGFTLPVLNRLQKGKSPSLRALVLVPTRELAMQVHDSVKTYGSNLRLRTALVYGGVGIYPQKEALRRGVDILIATPGRLMDHMRQRTVSFKNLEVLVIDEADRMLDMGFIADIRTIIKSIPQQRQTLLFSATMPAEIQRLANEILKQPEVVEVARQGTPASGVRQVVYPVDVTRKSDLLVHLIEKEQMSRVLVFTRTKNRAEKLATHLNRKGSMAEAIHGDKSQRERTQALQAFKNGDVQVLVATNVAARGLDVKEISHVVNYEMPDAPEDYVHRIGRTARAEKTGDAISLVSSCERESLRNIEKYIGTKIRQVVMDGFANSDLGQKLAARAEPSFKTRARRPGRSRRPSYSGYTKG